MATLTVYSDTADGAVGSSAESVYATARSGSNLNVGGGLTTQHGQYRSGTGGKGDPFVYYCQEGFVLFDTSALGSGATVSAAVLTLTSSSDSSVTDFTVNARIHAWGPTLTTADWVAGASLSGKTLVATHDTSTGWVANTAYDFTDVALPANVSKTATTDIILSSSRHEAGTSPTGFETCDAYCSETAGTDKDPKLVVTYTTPAAATATPPFHVQPTGAAISALWRNHR